MLGCTLSDVLLDYYFRFYAVLYEIFKGRCATIYMPPRIACDALYAMATL